MVLPEGFSTLDAQICPDFHPAVSSFRRRTRPPRGCGGSAEDVRDRHGAVADGVEGRHLPGGQKKREAEPSSAPIGQSLAQLNARKPGAPETMSPSARFDWLRRFWCVFGFLASGLPYISFKGEFGPCAKPGLQMGRALHVSPFVSPFLLPRASSSIPMDEAREATRQKKHNISPIAGGEGGGRMGRRGRRKPRERISVSDD